MIREVICTCCPRGCHLKIDTDMDYNVSGNRCPRGAKYGVDEVLRPKRIVTSTVALEGAALKRLPVRTDRPVDKDRIMEAMALIRSIRVTAPIRRGDAVSDVIPGTDARVIACRDAL